MIALDTKIVRAGINSAVVALVVGTALGTYGGWSAIFNLTNNVFGVVTLAVVFSVALGYIYSYWFANFLPGTIIIKGALFGILLWITFLILGGLSGFFKDAVYADNSGKILFLSLVVHCVWGATLSNFVEAKN